MIGDRIKQARQAAGLALRDLAEECGLSAMAISKYERGEITPSSEALLALGKALGVRVEYFFRDHEVALEEVEYRKHKDLPEKEKKRILSEVRDQLERWLELEDFIPTRWSVKFNVPSGLPEKVSSLDEVESVAQQVRNSWKLGIGAIPDLIDTLELHGLKVFATPYDADQKFDGLCAFANGKPVVVVGGKNWPGDRQRFTLAHELGHFILKDRLAKALREQEEKACNRFAGAFLVPKASAEKLLGRDRTWIEPRELQLLKEEWGMSMMAWFLRAYDLGIINRDTKKKLWDHFEANDWKQTEPGKKYPLEQPRGFEQLVYRALGEELIGESKAAELLGLSHADFAAQRNMDAPANAAS
jgi:Zn-dependent peptidase ImmA (M78 family)/transcriptional regulator with XRE-family HTH domain